MTGARILHCRHCGADNHVSADVVGKMCETCGKPIFAAELGQSEAATAYADRTGEVLRVTCPRCGLVNEFPGFSSMFIFACHHCGEPVQAQERPN